MNVNCNSCISIIIPVFNSEESIEKCLDSVLGMYNGRMEIVIINDGSTDSTSRIIDDFVLKFNSCANGNITINYLQTVNQGVSKARNLGLEIASGDFLLFLDSDDYISPDVPGVIFNALVPGGIHCFNVKDYSSYIKANIPGGVYDISEGIDVLYNANSFGFLHGKLYDRKIIESHHIRFDENISMSEDFIFNLEYMSVVEKVVIHNEIFYHYKNDNSSSLSKIDVGYGSAEYFRSRLSFVKSSQVGFSVSESQVIEKIKSDAFYISLLNSYIYLLKNKRFNEALGLRRKSVFSNVFFMPVNNSNKNRVKKIIYHLPLCLGFLLISLMRLK